jgi:hypothetical protein
MPPGPAKHGRGPATGLQPRADTGRAALQEKATARRRCGGGRGGNVIRRMRLQVGSLLRPGGLAAVQRPPSATVR